MEGSKKVGVDLGGLRGMKQEMTMIKIHCIIFLHINKSFAKTYISSKGKNAQNDHHRQKGIFQLQMSSKHAMHMISMSFSCGSHPGLLRVAQVEIWHFLATNFKVSTIPLTQNNEHS